MYCVCELRCGGGGTVALREENVSPAARGCLTSPAPGPGKAISGLSV